MKVLITGASGLLGRAIKSVFDEVDGWEVQGLGYNRLKNGLKKVDLRNEDEIREVISNFRPDVVIHSAVERNYGKIDKYEKESWQLNVTAPEIIAKAVNEYGGFLLYISTNFVFDGSDAPYKTTDETNAANKYGITKLEGEKAVQKHCDRVGILRLPMMFGEVEYVTESSVTGMLTLLQNTSKKITVSDWQRKYPTDTRDVAIVCRQIVERYVKDKTFVGIWHWCNNERLTKYEIVKIIAKVCNLSMAHIESDGEKPTGPFVPPFDCEMDCSDLESVGIGHRSNFEESIKKYLQPFVTH